jgi:hypothetical protein
MNRRMQTRIEIKKTEGFQSKSAPAESIAAKQTFVPGIRPPIHRGLFKLIFIVVEQL